MLLRQIRVIIMVMEEEKATIVGLLVVAASRSLLLIIVEVGDVELVGRRSIKGLAASVNPWLLALLAFVHFFVGGNEVR